MCPQVNQPRHPVEGEIGDIGTGSEIQDEAPDLPKGVPYKILPFAVESVKQVVRSRLRLFSGPSGPSPMQTEGAER
jgi:hypothetical protein